MASGTVVKSGQVLAVIEEGAAATPKAPAPAAAATAKAPPAAAAAAKAAAPETEGKDAGKLSPSVRRLVEENRLDPAAIPASGRDGRLTKSDVVDFLGKKPAEEAAPAAARPRGPRPPARAASSACR